MNESEPDETKGSPSYREELPADCPPNDATEVAEAKTIYRLVKSNPATEDDFQSQRALSPDRVFSGVTECQARGLSVHSDRSDSENLMKLPRLKHRLICKVTLKPGAGKIKPTGKPTHHTWWPLADFDILINCEIEN